MTHLEYEYRKWLVGLAMHVCSDYGDYSELFEYLYSREFYSDIAKDYNRAEDGKELRIRFADEYGISVNKVYGELDGRCSVLEMMLALAIRCEEQIMWDPELGDRTGLWFHDMLVSMHIDDETDGYFDVDLVKKAVDTMLNRTYRRNGSGGLFTLRETNKDMRKAEIWYQLNWYLNEVMGS